MLSPNVGEYWYVHCAVEDSLVGEYNTVQICKIEGIVNDKYLVQVNKQAWETSRVNVLRKWEPNWFWKLLGYK